MHELPPPAPTPSSPEPVTESDMPVAQQTQAEALAPSPPEATPDAADARAEDPVAQAAATPACTGAAPDETRASAASTGSDEAPERLAPVPAEGADAPPDADGLAPAAAVDSDAGGVDPVPAVHKDEASSARAEPSPAQTAELLRQHFPALFGQGCKPMKLRIQADIQARSPGVFSRRALGVFFHRYTQSNAYLQALTRHTERFDLDGQAAGELSEEHRRLAHEELLRRRQVHRAREAAARAARPPLPANADGAAPPSGAVPMPAPDQTPGAPPRGRRPPRPGSVAPADAPRHGPRGDGPAHAPGSDRRPRRGPQAHPGQPTPQGRPNHPGGPRAHAPQRRAPAVDGAGAAPQQHGAGAMPPSAQPAMPRPAQTMAASRRPDHPTNRPRPAHPRPPASGAGAAVPHGEGMATPDVQNPRAAMPHAGRETPLSPEALAEREARRQRAQLLRDFERSPFSLASFCALKGLTPEALTPILEQARREAGAATATAARRIPDGRRPR